MRACTHAESNHLQGRHVYLPSSESAHQTHASIMRAAQKAERSGSPDLA